MPITRKEDLIDKLDEWAELSRKFATDMGVDSQMALLFGVLPATWAERIMDRDKITTPTLAIQYVQRQLRYRRAKNLHMQNLESLTYSSITSTTTTSQTESQKHGEYACSTGRLARSSPSKATWPWTSRGPRQQTADREAAICWLLALWVSRWALANHLSILH